jgi:hypothetical protein
MFPDIARPVVGDHRRAKARVPAVPVMMVDRNASLTGSSRVRNVSYDTSCVNGGSPDFSGPHGDRHARFVRGGASPAERRERARARRIGNRGKVGYRPRGRPPQDETVRRIGSGT